MSSSTQAPLALSLKNILFATDFSTSSQAVFPYLRAFAESYGSTIHVVHVLGPEPKLEIPMDWNPELDASRDAARTAMEALLARNGIDKIAHTTTIERGHLWDVLATVIKEKSIDLIMLGSHGRQGLKRLVLGSVAEQVFRLAQCPVLTVGPAVTQEGSVNTRFATILFATDFSGGSKRALQFAAALARDSNPQLILLHAVSTSVEIVPSSFGNVGPATVEVSTEFVAEAIAEARQRLQAMISAENLHQLKPEVIVVCGAASEMILEVAKTKNADLIVMGAHRSSVSPIISHLTWATASHVICKAHCPVLSVRN